MALTSKKQNKRSNLLVLIESLLVGYMAYVSSLIVVSVFNAPKPEIFALAFNIGVVLLTILICSLSVGLYETKLRETFRGIIRRIFVSVALSYFIVEIFTSTLFESFRMHSYYLPISSGMIIISLVVFRYFSLKLGLLGIGRSRIVVIGAGERASIIEKRMRRDVDRLGFELLGFIPVPGDNREDGIKNEKLIHVKVDENFRNFVSDNDIEELIIACDQRRGTLPIEMLFDCRLRGVEVTDLLDFMERETGQIVVNLIYPSWVIYSNGFNSQNYLRDALDYSLNAFIACFVLIFTWPFMLITAAMIYFDDGRRTGSSVFYKQLPI